MGLISSAFSIGNKDYGGIEVRTAIMAVIGGTTSELSGGKFSNGAISGAFVHMYNAELGNALAIAKENNRIQKMSGDEFRTKMNYVGTDDNIVISKLSLDQDFRSPFISKLGKASSSGANIVYSSHPINASPKSILGFSGWLSTDSSLTFAYDCHSVLSCNAKIYK